MKVRWYLQAVGKEDDDEPLQGEWVIGAPLQEIMAIVPPLEDDPEMYAAYFPLTRTQVDRLARLTAGNPVVDLDRYEYALQAYRD